MNLRKSSWRILDERRYVPNRAVAAALTARSIFDREQVSLPETLVFSDRAGTRWIEGRSRTFRGSIHESLFLLNACVDRATEMDFRVHEIADLERRGRFL